MKRNEGSRLSSVLLRKIEQFGQSLARASRAGWERRQFASIKAARLFGAVNYQSVLSRGYALVLTDQNRVLRTAQDVRSAQTFTIRLGDGDVAAQSLGLKRKRAGSKPDAKQSMLF